MGDVYKLSDPDTQERRYVRLWKNYNSINTGESTGIVNDGDEMMVIEGPVEVITRNGEKVKAVKVQRGSFDGNKYQFTESPFDSAGWLIADYWLGEKLTPIGYPEIVR